MTAGVKNTWNTRGIVASYNGQNVKELEMASECNDQKLIADEKMDDSGIENSDKILTLFNAVDAASNVSVKQNCTKLRPVNRRVYPSCNGNDSNMVTKKFVSATTGENDEKSHNRIATYFSIRKKTLKNADDLNTTRNRSFKTHYVQDSISDNNLLQKRRNVTRYMVNTKKINHHVDFGRLYYNINDHTSINDASNCESDTFSNDTVSADQSDARNLFEKRSANMIKCKLQSILGHSLLMSENMKRNIQNLDDGNIPVKKLKTERILKKIDVNELKKYDEKKQRIAKPVSEKEISSIQATEKEISMQSNVTKEMEVIPDYNKPNCENSNLSCLAIISLEGIIKNITCEERQVEEIFSITDSRKMNEKDVIEIARNSISSSRSEGRKELSQIEVDTIQQNDQCEYELDKEARTLDPTSEPCNKIDKSKDEQCLEINQLYKTSKELSGPSNSLENYVNQLQEKGNFSNATFTFMFKNDKNSIVFKIKQIFQKTRLVFYEKYQNRRNILNVGETLFKTINFIESYDIMNYNNSVHEILNNFDLSRPIICEYDENIFREHREKNNYIILLQINDIDCMGIVTHKNISENFSIEMDNERDILTKGNETSHNTQNAINITQCKPIGDENIKFEHQSKSNKNSENKETHKNDDTANHNEKSNSPNNDKKENTIKLQGENTGKDTSQRNFNDEVDKEGSVDNNESNNNMDGGANEFKPRKRGRPRKIPQQKPVVSDPGPSDVDMRKAGRWVRNRWIPYSETTLWKRKRKSIENTSEQIEDNEDVNNSSMEMSNESEIIAENTKESPMEVKKTPRQTLKSLMVKRPMKYRFLRDPPTIDNNETDDYFSKEMEGDSELFHLKAIFGIPKTKGKASCVNVFNYDSKTYLSVLAPKYTVTCGRCKKMMELGEYKRSHRETHYYLCWLEGEEPMDLKNKNFLSQRLRLIIPHKSSVNRLVKLTCDICNEKTCNSASGFVNHFVTCGDQLPAVGKRVKPTKAESGYNRLISRGEEIKSATSSNVPLFMDLTTEDWIPLSDDTSYCPSVSKSMNIILNGQLSSTRLPAYESSVDDGIITLFAAGPVWALSWIPLPKLIKTQYLTVATHPHMNIVIPASRSYFFSSVIQIWEIQSLSNSSVNIENPKLALKIAHDFGAVWSMEWCPSGGYVESIDRLGLLAVATSSGLVLIYSVPISHKRGITVKAEPALSLALHRGDSNIHCTRISWEKCSPHRTLFGGFSNGLVAMWQIDTKSPMLREGSILFAYKIFQPHSAPITVLANTWMDCSRYLTTGSLDSGIKFWDLKDLSSPLHTVEKGNNVLDACPLQQSLLSVVVYDHIANVDATASLNPIRANLDTGNRSKGLVPFRDTFWGASISDWTDEVAICSNSGNVYIYLYNPDKSFTTRSPYIQKCLISELNLLERRVNTETSSQKREIFSLKKYKTEFDTPKILTPPHDYENAASRYIIQTKDVWTESFSSPKNPLEPGMYQITSANKVCWNQNYTSFEWLAIGYQVGFVRIMRVPLKTK